MFSYWAQYNDLFTARIQSSRLHTDHLVRWKNNQQISNKYKGQFFPFHRLFFFFFVEFVNRLFLGNTLPWEINKQINLS